MQVYRDSIGFLHGVRLAAQVHCKIPRQAMDFIAARVFDGFGHVLHLVLIKDAIDIADMNECCFAAAVDFVGMK